MSDSRCGVMNDSRGSCGFGVYKIELFEDTFGIDGPKIHGDSGHLGHRPTNKNTPSIPSPQKIELYPTSALSTVARMCDVCRKGTACETAQDDHVWASHDTGRNASVACIYSWRGQPIWDMRGIIRVENDHTPALRRLKKLQQI